MSNTGEPSVNGASDRDRVQRNLDNVMRRTFTTGVHEGALMVLGWLLGESTVQGADFTGQLQPDLKAWAQLHQTAMREQVIAERDNTPPTPTQTNN
jgi:hypothetical protein